MRKIVLRLARNLGLFSLARRITKNELRILCYHGVAIGDECRFRPMLFMSSATFEGRLRFLKEHNYPVLSLDDAIERLQAGKLTGAAVVITIDDGWYGTYKVMGPLLREHGLPATLYISSYYLERQYQVFNVAISYILWRSDNKTIRLSDLSEGLSGIFDLSDTHQKDQCEIELVSFAKSIDSAEKRQELLRSLCNYLGMDWSSMEADRQFTYMDAEEARELCEQGVDIQLHTHRHTFPSDSFSNAMTEVEENRQALSQITDQSLNHFCYPSGEYKPHQLDWLAKLGIKTATTTKPGLNSDKISVYELRRFLDSEVFSILEFDAEVSGFMDLLRRVRHGVTSLFS